MPESILNANNDQINHIHYILIDEQVDVAITEIDWVKPSTFLWTKSTQISKQDVFVDEHARV